jgi:uncharacterized protein (DUF4415 family)
MKRQMRGRGDDIMKESKNQRLKNIEEIHEKDIDYSDIPELDDSFWNNAKVEYPENKKPVTLRLDRDVLDWFKSTGKGYQTRINAILRTYVEAHKQNAS